MARKYASSLFQFPVVLLLALVHLPQLHRIQLRCFLYQEHSEIAKSDTGCDRYLSVK